MRKWLESSQHSYDVIPISRYAAYCRGHSSRECQTTYIFQFWAQSVQCAWALVLYFLWDSTQYSIFIGAGNVEGSLQHPTARGTQSGWVWVCVVVGDGWGREDARGWGMEFPLILVPYGQQGHNVNAKLFILSSPLVHFGTHIMPTLKYLRPDLISIFIRPVEFLLKTICRGIIYPKSAMPQVLEFYWGQIGHSDCWFFL